MVNYSKLTTAEIDGILMLNYQPKRREKVSLSDHQNFEHFITARINGAGLQEEFGKNILSFIEDKVDLKKPMLCYKIFTADMHIFKMAALKTFHDFSEILKS